MYTTIGDIKNKIIDTLTAELQITDPNFNADLLEVKVDNVLDEAQTIRGYDKIGYSDALIVADMTNGIPIFISVSRYDYNQIGAEGQTQYTGDGETIRYIERDKMWRGWTAIARIS